MFQVQVFEGGADDFQNVLYAPMHQGTVNFLQSQFTNVMQNAGAMLTDAAKNFYAQAQQAVERVTSSEALRAAKAAINKIGGMFEADVISSCWTLAKIQNAVPVMQQYIMANPEVRALYHDQRIAGYPDSYYDSQPESVGMNHIDYLRVINGIVEPTDDGWRAVIGAGLYEEFEGELDIVEQISIMNTWEMVNHHLKMGEEDPTDPARNML